MRYPHYLTHAAGGRWPARIVCLSVAPSQDCATGTAGYTTAEHGITHACTVDMRQGRRNVNDHWCSESVEHVWEYLRYAVSLSGPTWIISHDTAIAWSLLGLWEAIERGDIVLLPDDARTDYTTNDATKDGGVANIRQAAQSSCGALARARERSGGYLVSDGSTHLLRARFRACPSAYVWTDPNNYGIAMDTANVSGTSRRQWLVEFVASYHHVCISANLGSMQATSGSQAMHGFRHGHYARGIYVHSNGSALSAESGAYFGGRCETYRIGRVQSPLWYLDLRSAYGAVCAGVRVPVRLTCRIHCDDFGAACAAGTPADYLAAVRMKTEEPAYPYRTGADTLYPTGEYDTVLAGPELSDAIYHGRVTRCHYAYKYECEYALRSYAENVYECRREADAQDDKGQSAIAKRLLVSLAGKFGQRDRRWINVHGGHTDCMYGTWIGVNEAGEPTRYRSVGGIVQADVVGDWSNDACPAIAAWITSACRVRLLSLIRQAGWDHVYYVDTDAIMVDEIGRERLNGELTSCRGEMGCLEQRWGPCNVELLGAKYYVKDGAITCAGMPRGQCEDAGDGRHYWYTETVTDSVRRGQRPSARKRLVPYSHTLQYRGGVVHEYGTVTPHQLGWSEDGQPVTNSGMV